VTSERTRTQAGNIADCFAKLHTYILAASAVPTAPSAAARARITTLCVLMRRCGQPAVSLTFARQRGCGVMPRTTAAVLSVRGAATTTTTDRPRLPPCCTARRAT
jgi:hypothetical protein